MAMPKKRMSPVRSANRRRQIGLDLPSTVACPNCKSTILRHRACKFCGQYKGREIVGGLA